LFSIRKLLNEWEYDSGKNIRIINDRRGKPVMQVREMMGISELELEGRPDGSFYKGFDTVLDEVLLRLEKNESSFVLSDNDLAELEKEAKMFYYRYLLCFQISDFGRVVKDTEHNLKICEITEMYSSSTKMRVSILQYRPFIVKMNAISRAMISLQKNVKELAKDILENAIVTLKSLPDVNSSIFIMEKGRSINYLETALKQLGFCKNDSLDCMKKELFSAVESEDYEKAAQLRDRIKQLSKEIE
jgi:hypothetical protein